ncbi:hypothetical protein HDV62DRAFT_246286 [Trichoderma sp. SZMC 28011]
MAANHPPLPHERTKQPRDGKKGRRRKKASSQLSYHSHLWTTPWSDFLRFVNLDSGVSHRDAGRTKYGSANLRTLNSRICASQTTKVLLCSALLCSLSHPSRKKKDPYYYGSFPVKAVSCKICTALPIRARIPFAPRDLNRSRVGGSGRWRRSRTLFFFGDAFPLLLSFEDLQNTVEKEIVRKARDACDHAVRGRRNKD